MCLLTTGQSFSVVTVNCLSVRYKLSILEFSAFQGNSTLNSNYSVIIHVPKYGAYLINEGYIRIVHMHWDIE